MISGRNQYHIDERDWRLNAIKFEAGDNKGVLCIANGSVYVSLPEHVMSVNRGSPIPKKETPDLHILFKASFRSGFVRAETSS